MELFYLSKYSIPYLLLICGSKGVYSTGKEDEDELRSIRPFHNNQQNEQYLSNSGYDHSPNSSGSDDSSVDEKDSGTENNSNEVSQRNKSLSSRIVKPTENDSEVDKSNLIIFTASGIIATIFILTLVALSFVYLKERNKLNILVSNSKLEPEELL